MRAWRYVRRAVMSRFAMRVARVASVVRAHRSFVRARETHTVVARIRPIARARARGARGGVARAIAAGWVCVVVMSGVSRVVVVVVVFVLTVLCVCVCVNFARVGFVRDDARVFGRRGDQLGECDGFVQG